MDFIPPHKYLQWNPNTLEEIRRDINLHRPGEMKEAVRILHEWIQQQPHFKKKDFPFHMIELFIVMAKGSIEKTKAIIDGVCTIKTSIPEFFVPYNPKVDFQHVWEKNYFTVTTKLTTDNYRIYILKLVGKYDVTKNPEDVLKYNFYLLDYVLMHDYASGVVIIYDLLEADLLQALKNYNLGYLKSFYIAIFQNYSIRLKQFHLLTKSKVIEAFIKFLKPFLKDKIISRIVVHKCSDELHTYYTRDILPKDYGGDLKSISELHEQLMDMVSTDEHMKLAKSMLEARVDECLRPRGQLSELYTETLGSFRSLNVD